jgi:sulfatase maturation enzyme AslB (radical SAM superfamily)
MTNIFTLDPLMLYLFLNIFFIQIAILSSNHDQMTDQSLNNYTTGFYDENLLDNWIKSEKITDVHEIFLLKEVISKVGSLLSVLKIEHCIELKKMIIESKIDISNIGYPYFVLVNILDSLKRIFQEIGTRNTANLKYDDENLNDFEKFLFFEFDSIYIL